LQVADTRLRGPGVGKASKVVDGTGLKAPGFGIFQGSASKGGKKRNVFVALVAVVIPGGLNKEGRVRFFSGFREGQLGPGSGFQCKGGNGAGGHWFHLRYDSPDHRRAALAFSDRGGDKKKRETDVVIVFMEPVSL